MGVKKDPSPSPLGTSPTRLQNALLAAGKITRTDDARRQSLDPIQGRDETLAPLVAIPNRGL